ncbi:MAG: OmpH family outer membrane protein [Spirochaetaceae bacterium]|jgi:outer membrane protein|nr:OmpH family outer membrane protein [Spirochaetaceae bacterium]
MKRFIISISIIFVALTPLAAQQLTRFALVDMTRIYETFFRDSRPVREWQEQSNLIQAEVNRQTAEIEKLQQNKADAIARNDTVMSAHYDSEIYTRTQNLQEYYRIKTAELEERKKNLSSSSDFLNQVNTEIQYIAESEGYTMVLDKNETKGIVWSSASIDITDKVLASLLSKVR